MKKSTLRYKAEQITRNELDIILAAGSAALASRNQQNQYHLAVIQDKAYLKKLNEKTHEEWGCKATYEAPTFIVVSGPKNKKNLNVEYFEADGMVENMHLAAGKLGLGSVYIYGGVRIINDDNYLLKALKLPAGHTPLSGLAVGYRFWANRRENKTDKIK